MCIFFRARWPNWAMSRRRSRFMIEALELMDRVDVGTDPEELAELQFDVAAMYVEWEHYAGARELLAMCLGTFKRKKGPRLAVAIELAAHIEEISGRYLSAIAELERAAKIWQACGPEKAEELATNLEYRAGLLDQLKRKDSANWLRERSRRGARGGIDLTLFHFRTGDGGGFRCVIDARDHGFVGEKSFSTSPPERFRHSYDGISGGGSGDGEHIAAGFAFGKLFGDQPGRGRPVGATGGGSQFEDILSESAKLRVITELGLMQCIDGLNGCRFMG